MSTVYLLGAGFSKALSNEMPLMSDLAKPELPDSLVGLKDLDVEAAFSLLYEPQPWRREEKQLEAASLASSFRSALASQIGKAQNLVVGSSSYEANRDGWGKRFVELCESRSSTVLTMNYDLLFERIYHSHLPNFAPLVTDASQTFSWGLYGLSFPLPRETVPGGVRDRSAARAKLLKLHGSLNWLQDRRNPDQLIFSDLYLGDEKQTEETRLFLMEEFPGLESFLVPPLLSKPIHRFGTRYLDLWIRAADSLKNTRELVALGYSFPPSDIAIRGLIAENLPKGSSIRIVRLEAPKAAQRQMEKLFPNQYFEFDCSHSDEGNFDVIPNYLDSIELGV